MLLRRCVQISVGLHVLVLSSAIIISRLTPVIKVPINTRCVMVGAYVVDYSRKRGIVHGKKQVQKAHTKVHAHNQKNNQKKVVQKSRAIAQASKTKAKNKKSKKISTVAPVPVPEVLAAPVSAVPEVSPVVTSIGRDDIVLVQQQEHIRERMRELWSAPVGISPKKNCKILVQIDKFGAACDARITQSSGVRLFDMHVVAAAKKLKLDVRYGSITIELECGGEGICGE